MGHFDSTIHSISFSCTVNWGVKNEKTVIEGHTKKVET